MKPTLLILAAGIGSRYGSLKQMDKFGTSGETIIDYSVYDAIQAGFGKVVFVIRKNIEQDFREFFDKRFGNQIEVDYAFQELDALPEGINLSAERTKPWGTGHALLVAESKIKEPFAVINADDFYGSESFKIIANFLREKTEKNYCIVVYELANTLSENGYVSRGVCQADEQGFLKTITERSKIAEKDGKICFEENENLLELAPKTQVSMNLMAFTPDIFGFAKAYFQEFIEKNNQDLKAEFYLPTIVGNIVQKNVGKVHLLNTPEKWFGITYKEDKVQTIKRLADLVAEGIYPKKLWS
ncbi:MAG: nucleotidyltransferase [Bacteroidetes bacterium]|nr:MAG: nucleotidyltransferase [Bacteroidota bacterium]